MPLGRPGPGDVAGGGACRSAARLLAACLLDRLAIARYRPQRTRADRFLLPFAIAHDMARLAPRGPGRASWIDVATTLWSAVAVDRLLPFEARLLAEARGDIAKRRAGLFFQFDWRWQQRRIALPPGERAVLASKAAFARACAVAGLAHVPTRELPAFEPPACELARALADWDGAVFLKPDGLSRGRGAALLTGSPARAIVQAKGHRATGSLEQLATEPALAGAGIAQPFLRDHPEIVRWQPRKAASPVVLRLVTGREADGVAPLALLAHIPADDALPIATATRLGLVDPASGQVRTGLGRDAPLPGERILPCHAELLALGTEAHRALFPSVPLVGWDLMITPEGPRLLEANLDWTVAVHYLVPGGADFALSARFAACATGAGTA